MVSVEGIKALAAFDNLSDRLEMAARLTSGNIVEIGGGEGVNTLRFLKIAKEREGIVVVVDPFEQIEGADESYFKPYTLEAFKKTINQHPELSKHMLLIDLPSQHPDVFEELKTWKPIGFMFIDGLQDKASVLSDLFLAESISADVVCIDDYDRSTPSSQVKEACLSFSLYNKTYKDFIYNYQREAYFIK